MTIAVLLAVLRGLAVRRSLPVLRLLTGSVLVRLAVLVGAVLPGLLPVLARLGVRVLRLVLRLVLRRRPPGLPTQAPPRSVDRAEALSDLDQRWFL